MLVTKNMLVHLQNVHGRILYGAPTLFLLNFFVTMGIQIQLVNVSCYMVATYCYTLHIYASLLETCLN